MGRPMIATFEFKLFNPNWSSNISVSAIKGDSRITKYLLTLGSLSMRMFETWTATGNELFSYLTCLHTTTFTLPSIFSPLEI